MINSVVKKYMVAGLLVGLLGGSLCLHAALPEQRVFNDEPTDKLLSACYRLDSEHDRDRVQEIRDALAAGANPNVCLLVDEPLPQRQAYGKAGLDTAC